VTAAGRTSAAVVPSTGPCNLGHGNLTILA